MNINHQPLIQEYELMQLLKSLLFRSVGSPTCIFHGPKEFTKTVQVLGLIQLKQWFYKITPVAGGYHIRLACTYLECILWYRWSNVQKSLHQISRYWITQIQNSA